MRLSGWGRYPQVDVALARGCDLAMITSRIEASTSLIARGNGRSYGDAALNPDLTLSMLAMDRIIDFDEVAGILTCEAGVLLVDVISAVLPKGWFPPVVPGTRWVTLGGMAAADIHGKNHHLEGGFGRHVESMELLTAQGERIRCSRDTHPGLFEATLGGMGLTGIILTIAVRLKRVESAWLLQETHRAADIEACVALLRESDRWSYSVAWLDCIGLGGSVGRGLVFRADHALPSELPPGAAGNPLAVSPAMTLSVPFDCPPFMLNRWTVGAFNAIYARGRGKAYRTVNNFFFQLDALEEWPRLYGRRGFLQYQCVVPKDAGVVGLQLILERVFRSPLRPFLAVLKGLGPSSGPLSFPMEGYTLAMDFPMKSSTLQLFRDLDDLVSEMRGRLYLAKDAHTSPGMVIAGYPRLDEFRKVREKYGWKFHSELSRRLQL